MRETVVTLLDKYATATFRLAELTQQGQIIAPLLPLSVTHSMPSTPWVRENVCRNDYCRIRSDASIG